MGSALSRVFNVGRGLSQKMIATNLASSPVDPEAQTQAFRENLRKLDMRQWWLWTSTVLVLILLTVGVASFAFPAILSEGQSNYSFYLNQAVRALVGIVLLFSVYLVYQQTLIMGMRNQIADQLSITEETVKSRVKSILSKLGANDRTHAATIGVKRGIIEL